MEFDSAKENIQPLATGRNVSLLQASLSQDASQDLLAQRKKLEEDIRQYKGDDPLLPWYAYICWIEQSCPAGGSGSGLQRALHKCLSLFESDERYKQDRRFIKLFIKFMEKQEDRIECYQQMYNNGIGTMVADFYIAWAYSYDLSGNFRKADEIFRLGVACRAEPFEDLKEAHLHFGYTVSQRMMYTDGDEASAVTQELNERRFALQSLHGQRRKNTINVGSVRTGAAVRSHRPGVVHSDAPSSSRVSNAGRQVEVFNDENADANIVPTETAAAAEAIDSHKSSLRSIIDAARNQENLKEPGPWNKAHAKPDKHGTIFSRTAQNGLPFDIHVDETTQPLITNYVKKIDKPFKYPPNFVSKNGPQEPWITPVSIENEPNTSALALYNKCALYPRPNLEFSTEEYRAFCYLKQRNPEDPYVLRYNKWWGSMAGVRLYPNFATKSEPQPKDELDSYHKYPNVEGLQVSYNKLYNDDEQLEYQVEELLGAKWYEKHNATVCAASDMEETVCLPHERMPRRKSFFPTHMSVMATTASGSDEAKLSTMVEEEPQEQEKEFGNTASPASTPSLPMIPAIKIFEDPVPISTVPPVDNFVLPTKPAAIKKIEIYEDSEHIDVPSTSKAPASAASTPSLPMIPAIQIFEDPVPISTVPPVDNFVLPTKPAPIKKIEIYEDTDHLVVPSTSKAPASAFFDADETCSTQMFNVFIQSHAVSTPKATPKVARQFGTVLKELTPPMPAIEEPAEPEEATAAAAVATETGSPMLRKHLSTILETSEHGAQSSAATNGTQSSAATNGTTKSSNASAMSSCNTALAMKSDVPLAATPATVRLQRQQAVLEDSLEGETAERLRIAAPSNAGNFSRLDFWEANPTSVPLIKSLRFQEDKTETVPKSMMCFQDDKTETMPKLPLAEPSLHHRTVNESKLLLAPSALPPLVLDDDDDDLCNFFGKSPPNLKCFATPSAKRICDQRTPGVLVKNSFAEFDNEMVAKPKDHSMARSIFDNPKAETAITTAEPSAPKVSTAVEKLADSFMSDLSFVPETQAVLPPKTAEPKFEIFLDETMPSTSNNAPKTTVLHNSSSQDKQQLMRASMVKENMSMKSFHKSSQAATGTKVAQESHMTASFIKDFSEISKRPESAAENLSSLKSAGNSTLKFLNDSPGKFEKASTNANASTEGTAASATTSNAKQPNEYFELNAATEMFCTDISMIKNSTLLPEPNIRKKSLAPPTMPPASATLDLDTIEDNMSIYYKKTPLTPKPSQHSWHDSDCKTPYNLDYVHPQSEVDQSVLDATLADCNFNPFSVDLINSLLQSIEFTKYIEQQLPNCELVGHIKRLVPQAVVKVHQEKFEVLKMIGKGAYGSVFSGKNCKTGKKVALKQERPTNYWEYYVCLEVHTRVPSQMSIAYMQVDYALISNNCSIYISEFSVYGSLINICNRIKKHSNKNIDEYVVMHLSCQLLDIIDHLHAVGIIHADIKADNLLLMKPLSIDPNQISLQLIDFGVAIDTTRFAKNQTFNYVHDDDAFKCIEMRTQRPWTYQLDLFGVVSVIHVLLFGSYMEVVQRMPSGIWLPKTALPRYFNKNVWESIFRTLLNVRDCRTMPNLQNLRTLLKSELAEKEKYVNEAIAKFNTMLRM